MSEQTEPATAAETPDCCVRGGPPSSPDDPRLPSNRRARMMPAERRFPRSVFTDRDEPDARFSLANERTFLAWIRTGLALLAGGFALEALSLGIHPGFRFAASLLLLVAGVIALLQAWFGWKRTETALRQDTPLPNAPLTVFLTIVVCVVGVLVLIGVVVK